MASCSFYNPDSAYSIEQQTSDYCLSLVTFGMSSVQNKQVLFNTNEQGLIDFELGRCDEIEYVNTVGNIVSYLYTTGDKEVLIRILVLRNGL